MFSKDILQLVAFAIAIASIRAKFVKKISENNYELNINERGAHITQKVTLENDLVITQVPAHHDRVAITYIYDTSKGFAMKISPSSYKCELSRPYIAFSGTQQKTYLDMAALDDSLEERLEVNSSTTTHYELTDIKGPEVNLECIPENFKKFVPKGFQILLTHSVQITQGNMRRSRSNSSNVFFTDPLTQKRYEYGDHVDMFAEVFDFLPECTSIQQRRSKRSGWTQDGKKAVPYTESKSGANEYYEQNCFNQRGEAVRCYGLHSVTCDEGCDASEVGYDCNSAERDCYFVLTCPVVQGEKCIAHIINEGLKCRMCCRKRDCGAWLEQCEYSSDPKLDICPADGLGCPYYEVDSSFTAKKSPCKLLPNRFLVIASTFPCYLGKKEAENTNQLFIHVCFSKSI